MKKSLFKLQLYVMTSLLLKRPYLSVIVEEPALRLEADVMLS